MKILLLGGTGLISAPMPRDLQERGHKVTVFNRGKREANLPKGVQQMVGDRNEYAAFEAAMRAVEPFDVVIDMICYTPDDVASLSRAFAGRAT